MNRYNIPPSPQTLEVLRLLEAGVLSVSFKKDFPSDPWPTDCHLEIAGGRFVTVATTADALEFKFEVFPLVASVRSAVETSDRTELKLEAPVSISLFETESWLDPSAPTCAPAGTLAEHGFGSVNPIAQFNGSPGTAPSTATACCTYFGAVELVDANGRRFLIATAGFPCALHASGFYEDTFFDRGDYVLFRAEACLENRDGRPIGGHSPAYCSPVSSTLDRVGAPLSNDQLGRAIAQAFPASTSTPTDQFIEANSDLLWLEPPVDLTVLAPAYMSWCVRHALNERGTLVPDHTVRALAEFGRSKNPSIAHLNFKHTCSENQRAVVAKFLRWCLNPNLILDPEQIQRALKYWEPGSKGGASEV